MKSTTTESVTTKSIATQARLIAAAMDLFQSQGYYATGLNRILAQASCPKGSLYHHFPGGKSDLAVACIEQLSRQITAFIQQQTVGCGVITLLESLYNQTGHWLQKKQWQSGSLFAVLNHETTVADKDIRLALKTAYADINRQLCQVLMADGLDPETAKKFSLQCIINFEGALSLATINQQKSPLDCAKKLLQQSYQAL